MCWCETGLVSCPLWLAEEGRDENTGVKVECGMPPSVREIQNLDWVGQRLAGVEVRGASVQPSLTTLSYQPLTSPAWMVHSKGRADGVRAG